jgi:nephrocystin-3
MVTSPKYKDSPDKNRRIRVFVSSTFRDMQVDRDVLVKKVFPQLRKLCESRAVTWTEVDLRWGITEEQANEGKVLPLCLAEIERSRPYFISLLGERYGWIPNNISVDLLADQPWLKEYQKHSVTELEILHGVLNSPAMANRALFYFRDHAYVDNVDKDKCSDFVCENCDSADKLARLKNRIRDAYTTGKLKYAPHENYVDPNALAELVLADFTKLINELYPENQVPNPLDQEANHHEEHARSRRNLYVPRPQLYDILDRHIESDAPPLVLTGESGCGKTALLANWIDLWRKSHPQDLIIQHYIGSTPDSTSWERIVTRILGELKRAFSIPDDLPSSPDKLRGALDEWFIKSVGSRRIVLVLDGLNQLEDRDNARELAWLPARFIPNVRMVASALQGQAFDATQKRGWPTLKVELLNDAERILVVIEYLKQGGRTASKQLLEAIERQSQTCNPLYLRAFLDEIRQFGRYEELPTEIEKYLSAPTPKELFTRIIERWICDYPEARADEALKLIWAARRGLAESELMDLLGKIGQPLPRRFWTPFYLAAERSLVLRSGLLNFAHDYLRNAVQEMLVKDADAQDESRLRLADYFEAQPVSIRSCDELPWLLWKTESFVKLRTCLLDIDRFIKIFERDKEEVRFYWVRLGEERTMGKQYVESFEAWSGKPGTDYARIPYSANQLAGFLDNAALYAEAELIYRRVLNMLEKNLGESHPNVAAALNNLAGLLRDTNRFSEAEPLYRRALNILEKNHESDFSYVAGALNNLALLLKYTNRLSEAETFMRRALDIEEKNLGKNHPNVATVINNLAQLLQDTNRHFEAEPLMRQALDIHEKNLGKDHPNVALCLNNLARLLNATNRLPEAEPLYRRALNIDEKSFGKNHPNVASCLNNLAQLLQDTNRFSEAETFMRRALDIEEKCRGKDHSNVAGCLNNLAQLLHHTNRLSEAEPLMRRALEIDEKTLGKEHPNVARDLSNLAQLFYNTNRLYEAEPLLRRALDIDEKSLGENHPNVAKNLNDLAQLLKISNRFSTAEPLIKRALDINEKSYGKDHPTVAEYLINLADLLTNTNRYSEAEPLYRRALNINEKIFGKDHPNVAIALNNLSSLLRATNRFSETEPLLRRALDIDEKSLGKDHPTVAIRLNNLAQLLQATHRLTEAEPLNCRMVEIFSKFTRATGHQHPYLQRSINNYTKLLQAMGMKEESIRQKIDSLLGPYGIRRY